MRLAQTHVWPALRNFDASASRTATSRSASSKTIKGALPPNSKLTFLIVSADCFIRIRPTSVEPVKVILRTVGLVVSSSPMAGASMPLTMLITPFGMPARSARTARAKAESGVCSAGFNTAAQPAARPGANLRVIMAFGKFHGVIAPKTPIGCFNTMMRLSVIWGCRISPEMRRPSSPNQSMKDAP